jgi:hypothetical protein
MGVYENQQVTLSGGLAAFRTNHYLLTKIKDIYALLRGYAVRFA